MHGPGMIQLEDVSKSYDEGATYSVRDVSLEIAAGEFVALLGESGCGKTTTLKMINRLIDPSSGRIVVDGQDTGQIDPVALRRQIGYVIQGVGLFPHLTVGENIAVVPRLLSWSAAEIAERVDELLQLIQLPPSEYRDRLPDALSGGQRQRVGLARALAARPKIMLMDEPFGAIDPLNRDRLQDEYAQIHRDLGLTTVMVTHDMTEALLMADRIAVLSGGRLARVGTPREILTDPGGEDVARLMETPRRHARRLEKMLE